MILLHIVNIYYNYNTGITSSLVTPPHPFIIPSFFMYSRPFDAKNPFLAPVTINRRLNKAGDRHLMHLELDITGSKIR